MKTVMVFGTFDFFHSGHLHFLKQARRYGNRLIAVIGRDTTVRHVKGVLPIQNERERKEVVASIGLVDSAVLGDTKDMYAVIKKYHPDVIGLGYDQTAFVAGMKKYVARVGMPIRVVRLKPYKPANRKSAVFKNTENRPGKSADHGEHIVVPIALVIKEGRVLMQLRNDPKRPAFHKKWEFPGGGVEIGESIEGALIRETREEIGYTVRIVKRLFHIEVKTNITAAYRYQVYVIPFVCAITGGKGVRGDTEVLETRWFDLNDVHRQDAVRGNKKMFTAILPELQRSIREYSL